MGWMEGNNARKDCAIFDSAGAFVCLAESWEVYENGTLRASLGARGSILFAQGTWRLVEQPKGTIVGVSWADAILRAKGSK